MADVNASKEKFDSTNLDGLPQSVEEFWNEIEGPPLRQVTAMVVGFGNVCYRFVTLSLFLRFS